MSTQSLKSFVRQKDFEDFCKLPIDILDSVGYEFDNKPRSILKRCLKKCYFLAAALSHCYIFFFIIKASYNIMVSEEYNLALLLRLISGFIYGFFSILKCLTFFWHVKDLKEIFLTLKDIYPKTGKEKLSYGVNRHFWPKWILSILYFYLGVVFFIASSPLMESFIIYFINIIKMGWSQAEFKPKQLYEIEYSFDNSNILAYIFLSAVEISHAHFMVIFNISTEIWIIFFTLQLCMHFEYVANMFEKYEPNSQNFVKDQKFIALLVEKHQVILNIGERLNTIFGQLLLLLVISIAGILCCAGVYTLTQGLGREFLEYVAFLPTAVGQYYIVCYYGQKIIEKSQNVGEAAYNHCWYNGSQSYKKSIFIILMRSQKETELNALGFQPICLEAFKMVMGNTYQVFTLLKETML